MPEPAAISPSRTRRRGQPAGPGPQSHLACLLWQASLSAKAVPRQLARQGLPTTPSHCPGEPVALAAPAPPSGGSLLTCLHPVSDCCWEGSSHRRRTRQPAPREGGGSGPEAGLSVGLAKHLLSALGDPFVPCSEEGAGGPGLGAPEGGVRPWGVTLRGA